MMINFKQLLLVPLFGLALATNASAFVVDPGNILEGTNGLINVTEQEITDDSGPGIEYSLDILDEGSDLSIVAFGVSSNTMVDQYSSLFTNRDGWDAVQISAVDWDLGYPLLDFFEMLTTDMGTFSEFFGNDLYVNFFIQNMDSDNAITVGSDELFQFWFSEAIPTSDFIAIDARGTIASQSRGTQNIPEPAPLALLGLGLMGLGFMNKRRKS